MSESPMRILFVDDEPRVLEGLRRSLRRYRKEWTMEFVEGGTQALDRLDEAPFDVVVADMRMPGMDGAELLGHVQRRHPETVRLILSGYSESELILKSIGPTHQYLSKPCDPEELEQTVCRALALRSLLASEELRTLAAKLGSLPPLPEMYRKVVEELQQPDASLPRIGALVAQDVAMSAKILQVVNSAWFGLRSQVASIDRAVAYLGIDALTSLILAAQAFECYSNVDIEGFQPSALWAHSVCAGACARLVAKDLGFDRQAQEDAGTAALLHDVGRLIFAATLPEPYTRVLAATRNGASLDEAEREGLGADHGAMGAYLVGLWGLPTSVVEAIAYHADPARCPTDVGDVTVVVHVADCLAGQVATDGGPGESCVPDIEFLKQRGLAERWTGWRERCAEELGGGDAR